MTKEKEKAIRYVKYMSKTINFNKSGFVNGKESLEIVLNMLKEKDEEIQFQKDINKTEKDRHKQAEKSLKGHIEKKDKMIDLMSEHICNSAIVDDTVCAIKCDCETDINEDCTYEKMLNCTKQYFERKVEDECKR